MKFDALNAVVGVPEIVPVALSIDNPIGKVGSMVNSLFEAPDAVIDVVIGVIALPTWPVNEACDGVTATGVIITVVAVTEDPEPDELVATAETL